jgi:hypothetical protein
MFDTTEVRAVAVDGRMYERKPDGTLAPVDARATPGHDEGNGADRGGWRPTRPI